MEGKNKEFSTQDSFGAYLKTAVRNTKIKYIKKHVRIQEREIPIEDSAYMEAEFRMGDYYQHLEEQVGRLCEDFGDVGQLHIPVKKVVDTYYNTLKKLRREMQHG